MNNKKGMIFNRLIFSMLVILFLFLVMTCLKQNPFTIYPENTGYNDEAFYYKQILGVLKSGIPSGYFGYNDSRAVFGTFGAWSPIIIYLYSLLGIFLSFTKNFMYISNLIIIVFSMFCLFQFNSLNNKEMMKYSILLLSAYGLRHIYSGMVEPLFYGMIILIFSFYLKKDKKLNKIAFFIIFLSSAIRPYLLVLFLVFFNDRKNIKKELIAVSLLSLASLFIYFVSTKYFQAEFLYKTIDFSKVFLVEENRIIKAVIKSLYTVPKEIIIQTNEIIIYIQKYITVSDAAAVGYITYYLSFFIILIAGIIRRNRELLLSALILLIEYGAIILIYQFNTGFRHLYVVLLFCWLISLSQFKFNYKLVIFCGVFLLFHGILFFGRSNRWNTYPIRDYYEIIDTTKFIKSSSFEENTVYIEYMPDLETFRVMYYLPDYFGYNLCFNDYMVEISKKNQGYAVISKESNHLNEFLDKELMFENEKIKIFKLH